MHASFQAMLARAARCCMSLPTPSNKHANSARPHLTGLPCCMQTWACMMQGCQKANPFVDQAGIKICIHPCLQHYVVSALIWHLMSHVSLDASSSCVQACYASSVTCHVCGIQIGEKALTQTVNQAEVCRNIVSRSEQYVLGQGAGNKASVYNLSAMHTQQSWLSSCCMQNWSLPGQGVNAEHAGHALRQ